MKKVAASLIVVGFLAVPVHADQDAVAKAGAKAEEQFQKGKPEDALKTLQKVVEQNPTSPEAYRLLGDMQARTGGVDDAAKTLAKGAELSGSGPGRAGVLASLADLQLRAGSSKDALKNAQEAQKVEGATPSATTLAVLARAQARLGDPAAPETIAKALQAGGKNPAVLEANGYVLLSQNKAAEAVQAFRDALAADPKRTRARVGLATALLQQGNAAEAVTEAKKAADEDPKSGEALAIQGLALLAQDPSKNWNDAIAQAQSGKFIDPKNPGILVAVGKIFEAAGRYPEANDAYNSAVAIDPANIPAQTALVSVLVRQGKTDDAATAIEKLAALAPTSADVQLLRGRILLRKASKTNVPGDYLAAADALEKGAAGSSSAEAHALLGTAYQYTRRPDQALEQYEQAVKLAPNNVDYQVTYGLLLGVNQRYDAGIAVLKKVTANPAYKDAAAWVNLGWVYRNATPPHTDESVAAYKKALEIDPKNAQAALGMGWAYSFSRMWDPAIAAFQQAITIDPATTGEAYDGMAWSYFFKKDIPQARATYAKATAAGRVDNRLGENIAKVEDFIKRGQEAAARQALESTEGPKEEKPQGPDIGTLVKQLQSKSTEVRMRAVQGLAGAGRDGVPYLGYAVRTDADMGVRETALAALTKLGPGAKDALQDLQALANTAVVPNPNATKEEALQEIRFQSLRSGAIALIAKIQGRS